MMFSKENISLVSIIEHTSTRQIPALLLFIDFQKAFETLQRLVKWFTLFYTNISSCIQRQKVKDRSIDDTIRNSNKALITRYNTSFNTRENQRRVRNMPYTEVPLTGTGAKQSVVL